MNCPGLPALDPIPDKSGVATLDPVEVFYVLHALHTVMPQLRLHGLTLNAVRRSALMLERAGLYEDTLTRQDYRKLLCAAAELPGTLVAITFTKTCGESRTMVCQPLPDADETRRYVTVWDVKLGAHRRVNLDGVIKVSLETGAAARGLQPNQQH